MDNTLDTQSYMLQWLPTTGEFGLYGTFGDFDDHEKLATRLGVHYTRSTEDRQRQPGTDGIENSQIRLTDGSVIFTPDLFGPASPSSSVKYRMSSMDGGLKYKGMSLEARVLLALAERLRGHEHRGHPRHRRPRLSAPGVGDGRCRSCCRRTSATPAIYGELRRRSEVRAGVNWYPVKERGFRVNAEWHPREQVARWATRPYPMPVGANGNVFHVNLEMNF